MNRSDWLQALLRLDRPLSEILDSLAGFDWDSEQPLVTLRRQHVVSVLQRYVDNTLSAPDLEGWADMTHVRDDIGLEGGSEDVLREVLHELANPLLTRPLTKVTALEWIGRLSWEENKESGVFP